MIRKLLFLSLFLFAGAIYIPVASFAQTVQNPQQGSVGIEGTVQGDAPTQAAVITFPEENANLIVSPTLVRGTCVPNVLVQIYRNNVFAGSAICLEDGTFQLEVDLTGGANRLTARSFDNLNQEAPESQPVSITFNPLQVVDEPGGSEIPFILTSSYGAVGADPGTPLEWTVRLTGGQAPYAFSWNWGDGQQDLQTGEQQGNYSLSHVYELSGTYVVTVKVTDANNNVAFIQLVSIINGDAVAGITAQQNVLGSPVLYRYIVWPVYLMAILGAIAFFLGGHFMRRHYIKRVRKLTQVISQNKRNDPETTESFISSAQSQDETDQT